MQRANIMSTIESDKALQSRARRSRALLARALLAIAVASIVIGLGVIAWRWLAGDPWRKRIVRGEPVIVRFLCNTGAAIDCNVTVKAVYRKSDSGWCEDLQRSDQSEPVSRHWCNSDPEHNKISLFGVEHTFDRYGAVQVGDHLVGQLFLP
jgi:hypothetical protein